MEIELLDPTLEGSLDFKIIPTEPIFQALGKMPSSIEGLNKIKIGYISELRQ